MSARDSKRMLTREEVITMSFFPVAVLSDNSRSSIAAKIKDHIGSMYNHFMWYLGSGIFASQDLWFTRVPVEEYLTGEFRLKFWWNTTWTSDQSRDVLVAILRDLDKPWYRRVYDWPAIVGQYLNIPGLQVPGIDICSDKARYIAVADPSYNLEHPDPEDVNRWLTEAPGWEVYGRYVPD